jgi:hypothetical protein
MVDGYYYPEEVQRHQERQKANVARGAFRYELAKPENQGDTSHNYCGGEIQWETKSLEHTQKRGNHYVKQSENIVRRMSFRSGTANYDRYLISYVE